MKLLLEREVFTSKSTIGSLYIEKEEANEFSYEPLGYILEDTCREVFGQPETFTKVQDETAIPYGTYQVVISHSPRFQKLLPELLNVPHYKGIRIHTGNKAENSSGCLLPGTERLKDWVSNSKDAFTAIYKAIESALDRGEEVWIEITKGEEVAL